MSNPNVATRCIWGGEGRGPSGRGTPAVPGRCGEPTQTPVVHSVSFGYDDIDEWMAVGRGEKAGHVYGRNTNPTVAVFEEKLRALEEAEAATSFATGMAAVSDTLFALLSPGDRVVSIKETYGGTNKLFVEFLPRFDIKCVLCDTADPEGIEAEIAAGCRLLFLETPTNPTLKVIDIARLARAGHAAGATVVCDNTFATPINQNPLALGADLVVHSATKFLGGHADALGGAVCGAKELVDRIFHYREINGASLHPTAAYLLIRGMKTLALRVERQNESALRIARFLSEQEKVEAVHYPGLAGHEDHEIAARQMRGFGGLLSFEIRGGLAAAKRVLPRLRYAHLAANLGAVETVVGPAATTSHVESTPEEMAAAGVPEGLIRYSVGIEDVEDLIDDLAQAFEQA